MTTELLSMRPNLPVEDLDRAVAFYREVLGFELAARMDDVGFALMKGGSAELALVTVPNPQPGGGRENRRAVDHATLGPARFRGRGP